VIASRDSLAVGGVGFCAVGLVGLGILAVATGGTAAAAAGVWIAGTGGAGCVGGIIGAAGNQYILNQDPPDSTYYRVPIPEAPSLPEPPHVKRRIPLDVQSYGPPRNPGARRLVT
jgi:hypothetical protein